MSAPRIYPETLCLDGNVCHRVGELSSRSQTTRAGDDPFTLEYWAQMQNVEIGDAGLRPVRDHSTHYPRGRQHVLLRDDVFGKCEI